MPIDSRIYLEQRGSQADMGAALERGMRMGELYKKGKQERDTKAAYAAGMVTKEDGTQTFDRKATLSSLMKVNPEAAMQFDQQSRALDAEDMKAKREKAAHEAELIGRVAGQVKDQGSYEQGLSYLQQQGVDTSKMPPQWDPNLTKAYEMRSLSVLDRLKLENDALNRKEARDERRFQAGIKMDEKMQGLKTPYGLANTEEDAKNLKSAFEAKQNFDNKLQQMIDLRTKHGGGAILDREDVARGKQLSKDLLLEYKNMAKLGVLSKADEDIINAIIPADPLAYNSPLAAIQGQDPTLNRLKKFKQDSDADFATRVETRTRGGVESAAKRPQGGAGLSLEALLKEKERRSRAANK